MSDTPWRTILTIAVLGLAVPAYAHDPQPRNGGRIVHAGSYHVELVTRGTSVEAFLLGHDDKPVTSKGYQGIAILVVEGKSQRVPLAAAEGNRLAGTSPVPLADGTKGVVQITGPTGTTAQARFN